MLSLLVESLTLTRAASSEIAIDKPKISQVV